MDPVSSSNNFTDKWDKLLDYAFAPNEKNQSYVLFGALNETLVKINYTYSEETKSISMTKTEVDLPALKNVKHVQVETTASEVVVSISDGSLPGVTFFNHALEELAYFETLGQTGSPIMLSLHEPEDSDIL